MSRVFVRGIGAVSPAGWGAGALADALQKRRALPTSSLPRPGSGRPFRVRLVPKPTAPPACLSHPRLRRVSAITRYVVAAAFEALGRDVTRVQKGELRLGIVLCLMPGCVTYSRRFYEEVLKDPSTASPLLFPETVFHAPASHLAASLSSEAESYTLLGDESSFVQGVAMAAHWLIRGQVDGCLVVGAEEMDWIVADAVHLFEKGSLHSEGAGALYLTSDRSPADAQLDRVTSPFPFTRPLERAAAARAMRAECGERSPGRELLCESTQGLARLDEAEKRAWRDWAGERLAPKWLLGDAFTASAAWQCCAACQAIEGGEFDAAMVSVVGANQQAIGARFIRTDSAVGLHP